MRYTLAKSLIVKVRYYETMWSITDSDGERVYTGANEVIARKCLAVLNAYQSRKARAKQKRKRKRK